MKKLLFTVSVAALFLATGAAQATENYFMLCGDKIINVYGHHGYSFTQISAKRKRGWHQEGDSYYSQELPTQAFRDGPSDDLPWLFRGQKCRRLPRVD